MSPSFSWIQVSDEGPLAPPSPPPSPAGDPTPSAGSPWVPPRHLPSPPPASYVVPCERDARLAGSTPSCSVSSTAASTDGTSAGLLTSAVAWVPSLTCALEFLQRERGGTYDDSESIEGMLDPGLERDAGDDGNCVDGSCVDGGCVNGGCVNDSTDAAVGSRGDSNDDGNDSGNGGGNGGGDSISGSMDAYERGSCHFSTTAKDAAGDGDGSGDSDGDEESDDKASAVSKFASHLSGIWSALRVKHSSDRSDGAHNDEIVRLIAALKEAWLAVSTQADALKHTTVAALQDIWWGGSTSRRLHCIVHTCSN